MSLFCLRKSLETEEHSNISTHHQRAHLHNTKHDMSKGEKKGYGYDNKAYLRPGSDAGVRIVKKGVIFLCRRCR